MSTRFFCRVAAFLIASLLAAEGAVRLVGAVDFPLYKADSEVGYWLDANQSGEFLSTNSWVFNEFGMGVEDKFLPKKDVVNVLLVGDSIVLGGNTIDQPQKLAPQLNIGNKRFYWPVAAGSWSLLNQARFLKRNPQLLRGVSEVDFVVNSLDFGDASSWSCEQIHPTKRPNIALIYLFNKYLRTKELCKSTPEAMLVRSGYWASELRSLLNSPELRGKPVRFWLYPNKAETLDETLLSLHLEYRSADLKALREGVSVFSLARDARWKNVPYKDGIHVEAEGNKIMAEIIRSRSSLNSTKN